MCDCRFVQLQFAAEWNQPILSYIGAFHQIAFGDPRLNRSRDIRVTHFVTDGRADERRRETQPVVIGRNALRRLPKKYYSRFQRITLRSETIRLRRLKCVLYYNVIFGLVDVDSCCFKLHKDSRTRSQFACHSYRPSTNIRQQILPIYCESC